MDIEDFIVLENGNIRYNNNIEPPIAIEINNPRIHINCV